MHLSLLLASALSVRLVSSVPVEAAAKPLPGTWSFGPTLPTLRQEHSTVTLNGDIYVLGGIIPGTDTVNNPFPTVPLVQKFSTSTQKWTQLADMPVALNHANVAVVNGLIYVLGGLAPKSGFDWEASDASAVYDPSTNKWKNLTTTFPKGRAVGSASVGVEDGIVYLAGGLFTTLLNAADTEITTNLFTSYNTVTKQWAVLPSMPDGGRDHAAVGLVDGFLYVLGGRKNGHYHYKGNVFGYDICNQVWETNFAPMPTPRGGCASATIGSSIFAFGGEGNNATTTGLFSNAESFNTATNSWTTWKNMTTALHGSAAVFVNNQIHIAAGGTMIGGQPSNIHEIFTTS